MTHDLRPLSGPPFDAKTQAILDKHYPQRDGEVLSLFRVFARSPRLLRKLGAAGLLDEDSPLSLRDREIVILRTTAHHGCEYEWGVHAKVFAKVAGFSEEQLGATRVAPAEAGCWTATEQGLLRVVDELHQRGRLSEETLVYFSRHWETEQQLEILALCGFYSTVSFIANTAGLAPEPWAARFPGQGMAGS
ncbi:alkylhydroperoxidase family enzyme [Alloalcanivorax xenomutans]|mgnify:CR=1 FL=1|uniref:carboxymuconolactone decarboxylase family protein n=1 Tax=Alloalcanivorax xenomutans TaxID=1094342 RepID=UPI000BD9649F|nr:carboxymuconolactone decarboxylase family protein [Alloalcanivorax xenomutans]SOC24732.1 alkylhydroperoxidase family enzyme [Alloalcanivorax xenomutans]|tara:strand:- start:22 stop:594 length:573 start_codon:yes stop_codon:yes gene_type:complete